LKLSSTPTRRHAPAGYYHRRPLAGAPPIFIALAESAATRDDFDEFSLYCCHFDAVLATEP